MTSLDKYLASVKARVEKATPGPCEACGAPGAVLFDTQGEGYFWLCDARNAAHADDVYNGVVLERVSAHARIDVDRLMAMVEAGRKLARGIAAEYADPTQALSECVGKIDGLAEEYLAELDRIAGEGT